jgi:hypothetical protein
MVPILCRHFNPFDLRQLQNSELYCQGFINHFASKNWNLGIIGGLVILMVSLIKEQLFIYLAQKGKMDN